MRPFLGVALCKPVSSAIHIPPSVLLSPFKVLRIEKRRRVRRHLRVAGNYAALRKEFNTPGSPRVSIASDGKTLNIIMEITRHRGKNSTCAAMRARERRNRAISARATQQVDAVIRKYFLRPARTRVSVQLRIRVLRIPLPTASRVPC